MNSAKTLTVNGLALTTEEAARIELLDAHEMSNEEIRAFNDRQNAHLSSAKFPQIYALSQPSELPS